MFHPTSGRNNFEVLELPAAEKQLLEDAKALPSAATIALMMRREEELRQLPTTQRAYADAADDTEYANVNDALQLAVVREFGLPDAAVRTMRASFTLYSREELPLEKLPFYMRFNRSKQGSLKPGSAAVDVSLAFLTSSASFEMRSMLGAGLGMRSSLQLGLEGAPLVVAAGSYS